MFGSGPLIVREIVPATNDLDVVCRGEAWRRVQEIGAHSYFDDGNPVIHLFDGLLTFGTTWKYGTFDIDELIDTADRIGGLPFVLLEHVIAYKKVADRPKDREHLRLLAAFESGWSG